SVAISADGQTLVSGSNNTKTIKSLNLGTGELIRTLSGHSNPEAISVDGQTLVSSSWDDKTIKIWNLGTGKLIRTLSDSDLVWSVAISADGQTLVSSSGGGGGDNTIKIWRQSGR
ncbi:MAG: WD40 repeat domain-containing protein, partial [Dolichospermum sp.]